MNNISDLEKAIAEVHLSANRFSLLKASSEPDNLTVLLENLNNAFEKAAIESRNALERHRPFVDMPKLGAAELPYINIRGSVRLFEYQWLHIKLNMLLPHCRFQSPVFLSDTIVRLLDEYIVKNGKLPYYENALLIIDEHCDLKNRTVFDQDNKGWKAVSNALKGRVFPDDDQFSMGIALVSTYDENPMCNIYVINASDAGDFFSLRADGCLYY